MRPIFVTIPIKSFDLLITYAFSVSVLKIEKLEPPDELDAEIEVPPILLRVTSSPFENGCPGRKILWVGIKTL